MLRLAFALLTLAAPIVAPFGGGGMVVAPLIVAPASAQCWSDITWTGPYSAASSSTRRSWR